MRNFDWDFGVITEDEDPAYAGDHVPDSEDDIPCGDGFIPSSKECHNGDAHRPEPGENPYWTDENSAEERNERGVDWDDNKPSEPPEEEPDDPRDIQVWDKLRNRPETLELADLLQIAGLEPEEADSRDYGIPAQSTIKNLEEDLAAWREQPLLRGANLATFFKDTPKLALSILDRSARAGDRESNKSLWDNFGLSEQWHPSSYLFDHEKAALRATEEMKQMADWSGIEAANEELMQAGMKLAEAEFAFEDWEPVYEERRAALLEKRDDKSIKPADFTRLTTQLEDERATYTDAMWNAKGQVDKVGEKIMKEAEKIRAPIKESLRKTNAYNKIDAELAGTLLHNANNSTWAQINPNDPAYSQASGGKSAIAAKKLLALRQAKREGGDEAAQYDNAKEIEANLNDLFSIAHRDLLGAPQLRDTTWTYEVMERAYADPTRNTICLSSSAKGKPESADLAMHEFGHHIEFWNKDIGQRFQDFYERRTEGKEHITSESIDPKTGQKYGELSHYGANEFFKEDRFFDAYCGKQYVDEYGVETSELVSMGIQALYNPVMWGLMVRDDPEHLALIIASLKGY
jgi:hypothetical protein